MLISDGKVTHYIRTFFLSIISVIAISAFPVFFLYFQNVDEASFSEVIKPLLIFIAIGLLFFIFFLMISRSAAKSAIAANLFALVLLNYSLLEDGVQRAIPALRYWHILPIFLFILAHIAWFIWKKTSKDTAEKINLVLCTVFCGLIIFNGVIATPVIIKKNNIEKQQLSKYNTEQTFSSNSNLANIYYLIFDEYSSINFMKKYYNYDNSSLTNYLKKIGFNISYTSHNESIMTSTITANLVNLDYMVTNEMSESEKKYYRSNNMLFKLLRDKGYVINGVGDADFYGLNNIVGDINLTSNTADGKTISYLLLNKTVLWPFYTVSYSEDQKDIINALNYMKNPDNFSQSGCFTIGHIICPHTPFYFDKNGSPYSIPQSNWRDPKYYLEQYVFITKQIIEIVDSIIENDPESIIIIQSDHSARASTDAEIFLEMFALDDISNIFNAVYVKGKELNIEGLSGVNTLRLLLNEIMDQNFELINVPPDTYKYK